MTPTEADREAARKWWHEAHANIDRVAHLFAEIARLTARVDEMTQAYQREKDAWESRARRFEALIRYAEGFMFIDDKGHYIGRIFRDGTGWRQPGIGGAALLGTDLDSALRALSDAGLLPDDVKVNE